ncbi:unannotated protein [freshwater metagenome]|uniref:Unannotated protein n=1 Tax=freshwater metagenome TaxID=449393 RepID=A0A6J7JX01_9ZZZZ
MRSLRKASKLNEDALAIIKLQDQKLPWIQLQKFLDADSLPIAPQLLIVLKSIRLNARHISPVSFKDVIIVGSTPRVLKVFPQTFGTHVLP